MGYPFTGLGATNGCFTAENAEGAEKKIRISSAFSAFSAVGSGSFPGISRFI
jgi:hypothetical protein